MSFASSPSSGSGRTTDGALGAPVVVGWSKSCGSGVIGAEQFARQIRRVGQRRIAGQLLDLVARLDERSPAVSFAIPNAGVCDDCGEVLERVSSRRHVADLHLCPRPATAQKGSDLEERCVGDVVHSRPRCCRKRCRGAQQPLVRRKQLLDAGVVGSQKQAIAEQRSETARPSRRSNSAPQRTHRKHRTQPDRSSTANRHDRRQGRRLPTDDRPEAAHDKDRVNRTRPAIIRFPKDVVEQFVDLVTTTFEVPESNKGARPRRNDHRSPEIDIGLPLVHDCESMRLSSEQPAGAECLPRGRLEVGLLEGEAALQ